MVQQTIHEVNVTMPFKMLVKLDGVGYQIGSRVSALLKACFTLLSSQFKMFKIQRL